MVLVAVPAHSSTRIAVTTGVQSVMASSGRTESMMISASILDSVYNPFLQLTQLTMGCEFYCTAGLFGEVRGKLELLVFKLDSAARSSFIGKCRCKIQIQLVS